MKTVHLLQVILQILSISLLIGQDNTLTGTAAGLNLTVNGIQNSFYGRSAGLNITTGDENSFFGLNAGYGTITANTPLAALAEFADKNSFFGVAAGYNILSGAENTLVGYLSGNDITSANHNSFFGAFSGGNTTGSDNTFIGHSSGAANVTGINNTYVGRNSGQLSTGSRNTFIGLAAGRRIVNGDNNICIGSSAGPNTDGTYDHRLYIDVSQWDFPLIEGVFDGPSTSPIVKINGEFEVVGPFNAASDVNLKRKFTPIQSQEILEKIVDLPIQEWEYKKFEGDRHIGPTAQDFYATFGLGKGETTIASVDADGIALASIQALYDLIQAEKQRNDRLESELTELKQLLESKFK